MRQAKLEIGQKVSELTSHMSKWSSVHTLYKINKYIIYWKAENKTKLAKGNICEEESKEAIEKLTKKYIY